MCSKGSICISICSNGKLKCIFSHFTDLHYVGELTYAGHDVSKTFLCCKVIKWLSEQAGGNNTVIIQLSVIDVNLFAGSDNAGIFHACSFNNLLSLPLWGVVPFCVSNVAWLYTVPLVSATDTMLSEPESKRNVFCYTCRLATLLCIHLHWSYHYLCSTVERIWQNGVHHHLMNSICTK